jgi:transposase
VRVAPGPKAKRIWIPQSELRRLLKIEWGRSAPHGLVLRVRAVRLLGCGVGPAAVARRLDVSVRFVHKWRSRWTESPHLESLLERDRSGRPPKISIETRCEVVKIACNRPETTRADKRFRAPVWTQHAIVDELKRTTRKRISRSSVQRILSAVGLRPHRVQQWLHSPDPDFAAKVKQVCQLYVNPPSNAVVVCIDEKPMQALRRRHASRVGPGGVVRREFEYVRRGTRCLLAAFDVRTGHVIARVVPRRTGKAIVSFLDTVAAHYRGKQIHVVWDNLNVHKDGKDQRWTRFNRRHRGRFHFVFTPLHASWVNQVEIWFSILQRRVLRHGSFDDCAMLADHVLGFARHWNEFDAHPFHWTFSGDFVQTSRDAAAA